MPIDNNDIAVMLSRVAELIAEDDDLTQYSGIGKDLAGKIKNIVETGRCALLDDLRHELPQGWVS